MKAKIILKSLAELPASTLGFAASAPGRVLNASKQMLGATARATRREIRAHAPLESIQPWPRGGLNE